MPLHGAAVAWAVSAFRRANVVYPAVSFKPVIVEQVDFSCPRAGKARLAIPGQSEFGALSPSRPLRVSACGALETHLLGNGSRLPFIVAPPGVDAPPCRAYSNKEI